MTSAKQLRREVSSIISSSKPPKDNLTSRQHKAIRDLHRDKEIVVLPADKGYVTVVMNQSDYTAKMEELLEDSTYRKLKRDPTTKVEAKIASALKEPEHKGHLFTKQRLFLAPSFTSAPQIYGLLKMSLVLPHTNWSGNLSGS